MKEDRIQKEMKKFEEMLAYEKLARKQGYKFLAGIDEAGRGPLAGPVVAAACILDPDRPILGLNDSKKLTPSARSRLFQKIISDAAAWQIGIVGPEIIDEINILQATCQAMRKALLDLAVEPDLLLIDAVHLTDVKPPVWPIIRGDGQSVSIAAASILAKVTRDQMMEEYDVLYPEYGFAQHKGYGTQAHYDALAKYGPSPIHRLTFLKSFLEPENYHRPKHKKADHDGRQMSFLFDGK